MALFNCLFGFFTRRPAAPPSPDPSSVQQQQQLQHQQQQDQQQQDQHSLSAMEDTFHTLVSRLEEKRRSAGRPDDLDQMDQRQVADEKLALQKALLLYENMHGRPHTKREKDLMKPLYDRYRRVKKLLTVGAGDGASSSAAAGEPSSSDVGATGGGNNNYATISIPSGGYDWSADSHAGRTGGAARLHHQQAAIGGGRGAGGSSDFLVTQDFSLLRQTTSAGGGGSGGAGSRQASQPAGATREASAATASAASAAASAATNVALLTEEIRLTKEEKYKLQRMLKSFEHDFESQTGHKMAKVDRLPMQAEYNRYKNLKSKLKRLESQLSQATL